jgi:hypothetical protein
MMANMDRTREKLEDILSKKEYQVYHEDHRNVLEIWWDKAKSWIMDQLSKLFSNYEPSNGLADVIMVGVIVIVVLLVVLGVWLAIRSNRRKRHFRDRQPLTSRNEISWSFHKHLSAADEAEMQQHYGMATRHMFLAVLLYFHEIGWLEARSWKTNWEYYAELNKINKQSAEQFYNLALLFDEVVYGERVMQKDEYNKYREATMVWLNEFEITKPPEG